MSVVTLFIMEYLHTFYATNLLKIRLISSLFVYLTTLFVYTSDKSLITIALL